MSLSVKIIDNDTGRVLVDAPDSIGVMGVVATHGDQYVEGKTEHIWINSFGYVRCNSVAIYQMLTGLQKVMIDTQRRYPEKIPRYRKDGRNAFAVGRHRETYGQNEKV